MCQNVSENNTFDITQLEKMKEEIDTIPVRCGIVNNCGNAITALSDCGEQTLSVAQRLLTAVTKSRYSISTVIDDATTNWYSIYLLFHFLQLRYVKGIVLANVLAHCFIQRDVSDVVTAKLYVFKSRKIESGELFVLRRYTTR